MRRVAWLTDIHLNFVRPPQLAEFIENLRDAAPDVVLITGDIAESSDVVKYLELLDRKLGVPILFVLGNHDYYFGSIAQVRQAVQDLCNERTNLFYMSQSGPIGLTEQVGVVGHDGWADARLGDYERSMVSMNDYRLIQELAGQNKKNRWHWLKVCGDQAARYLRTVLPRALNHYETVYVLTHVPPFREACWYDGSISNDEWAPHFTCKAVGDVLLETARQYPDRQVIVLCGHTHGGGEAELLTNLRVLTGAAEYGFPAISRVLTL